jgi:hypothetical protein
MSLFGARFKSPEGTTKEIDGRSFGAKGDRRGPIGGGKDYRSHPRPTIVVESLDDLLGALSDARSGDVVHIPGSTVIECTERVYVEKIVLEVPEGVTLAGDRGKDGSSGALITSQALETKPLIQAMGPNVRVTGLRIAGPNARRSLEHHHRSFAEGRGHPYYYQFPTSDGIQTHVDNLTVDNCELAGWSHGAVHLVGGTGHHVHHNFIHHNQYQGLGYGISHDVAHSLIERNLFNHNRHSIAGTGRSGCGYVARHNVEQGTSLSHCFDMHGGRDRKDGTDTAGTQMAFNNNTFWCHKTAIKIRGVSEEPIAVKDNWFIHANEEKAVIHEGSVKYGQNAWGRR